MTGRLQEECALEAELRALNVVEDDGVYDSDVTPTNSPSGASVPSTVPAYTSLLNYPSSKTSGFWEDADMARYSESGDYSSCSNSSMSWGDEDFEGEATRQVSRLFEQLDRLLYQEECGPSNATSTGVRGNKSMTAAVVPLRPRVRNREINRNVQRSEVADTQQLTHSPSPLRRASTLLPHRGTDQLRDTVHTNKVTLPQSRTKLTVSDKVAGDVPHSYSDPTDEVVWKTIYSSENNVYAEGKKLNLTEGTKTAVNETNSKVSNNVSKFSQNKSSLLSSQMKNLKPNKLTTISEKMPKNLTFTNTNKVQDTLPNLDGLHITSYFEDDGVTDDSSNSTSAVWSACSSPTLAPPSPPPPAPQQPTALMQEECGHWTSRFIHLRVRGYGVDPLQLKAMEDYAFADSKDEESGDDEDAEDTEEEEDVNEEEQEAEEVEWEEEVLASDGVYDPNTSHLCLIGSYLPSNLCINTAALSSNKKDKHVDKTSGCSESSKNGTKPSMEELGHSPAVPAATTGKHRRGSDGQSQSRVCSSDSNDPVVLKEQLLLVLFDRLWPHVTNIVGDLVHSYANHLLSSSAQLSSLSRETSSRTYRTSGVKASSGVEGWAAAGQPSSARRLLRHPSITAPAIAAAAASMAGDAMGGRYMGHREVVASATGGAAMLPRRPSTAVNRLHTARTLMQLNRAPLSPVLGRAGHVVSLPSLELSCTIPTPRPLSSLSSLSTISGGSAHPAHARNNRLSGLSGEQSSSSSDSPPLNSLSSTPAPSPPWTRPTSTFLPPIAHIAPTAPVPPPSPDAAPINLREPITGVLGGRRAASEHNRRNSDSVAAGMTKLKVLPSLK